MHMANSFQASYGGILYAYDIKTGKQLWNYTASEIGHESPYGNYQISYGGVADGKIYIYSTEHSPTQPLWRGSYLRCINATDGTEIWKSLNFVSGLSIADGCVVAGNSYDNRMYVYGKGPSATTVSAPQLAVTKGSRVLITGTVTDQSTGAKDTPAIADQDMGMWMDYLYMKQAKPTSAKGVPVHLTVIDPNSNLQDIGIVTTDSKGNYMTSWIPPVSGLYKLTAIFEGSNSYYSSDAETGFIVSDATSATPAVSPTPTEIVTPSSTPVETVSPLPSPAVQPPNSGLPTTTYIAIGVAIIIVVAVAAALTLRRRQK